MSFDTIARVPTQHAARYLQQLCKHWSHNLAVRFTHQEGEVCFPRNARGANWPADATLALRHHDDRLECLVLASAAGQRDALKDVLARHLDRFAVREAPLAFDWRDA